MRERAPAGRLKPTSTIGGILLACSVLAGGVAQAEYLAYAVVDGARSPLPESIGTVDASYLADLEWDYRGGRSMIEVRSVEDVRDDGMGDVSLVGIGEVVAEALRRTGRFVIRDGTSGMDNGEPRGRTSMDDGYALHVALAEYAVRIAESVSNPRAVRTRVRRAERGRVAIDLRLLDVAGRAVIEGRFRATVSEPQPGVMGFGDVGGFPSDIWTESIGQAILAAANKGAFEIFRAVGPLPLSGRVVKAEGDRVWINLGIGSVSVGDRLEVTAPGEPLVDPETGLDLGVLEETVGTVRVTQVEDRFSIAEALSISAPPSRGDSVRSAAPVPEFKFAPDWKLPGPGLF